MSFQQDFFKWIHSITATSVANEKITGFNFGLIETEEQYLMYLTGSEHFDADDDDWATEVDFEPANKYLGFGKTFSQGKEWNEVLEFSKKILTDFIESEAFSNSFLKNAVGITTGFDDGELSIVYLKDADA
ncbi:hypothetical protein [Gynurincola endophyticus]|uniref:hypothetical protein n=1 Tax=Gynurincola endophyticus TaxID=2479004 RepID=UPI000F8CFEB1|nr:hypothetical protein [Gynurincola endophyticus]